MPEIDCEDVLAFSCGLEGRDLGIIASSTATDVTTAHEIGHVCGLMDIYESVRGIASLQGRPFVWQDLPGDWGSTSPRISFYGRKDLTTVVKNLLMNGHESRIGTDISFGPVLGIWYDVEGDAADCQMERLSVGVIPRFNRHPRHE